MTARDKVQWRICVKAVVKCITSFWCFCWAEICLHLPYSFSWKLTFLQGIKCICTRKFVLIMWKWHSSEVHCTYIQRKGVLKCNIMLQSFQNTTEIMCLREDYSTPGNEWNYFEVHVVSSQTLCFWEPYKLWNVLFSQFDWTYFLNVEAMDYWKVFHILTIFEVKYTLNL